MLWRRWSLGGGCRLGGRGRGHGHAGGSLRGSGREVVWGGGKERGGGWCGGGRLVVLVWVVVEVVGRRGIGISGWGRRGLSRRMSRGGEEGCLFEEGYLIKWVLGLC